MRRMFRLILFDIDGTLISTGGAGVKAFAQTCDEVFNLPEATKNLIFAGRTDRGLIKDIFQNHQIPETEENVAAFFEGYLTRLENFLPDGLNEPLPGVRDFIAACRQLDSRPHIGLLTGNHPRGAALKLGHYGLWNEFAWGAFGGEETDRNQVAHQARQLALKDQPDLQPEEILIIGDTPRDIHCARAIGAKVLAVATGPDSVELLEPHQPDWVAANLNAIRPAELY